MIAKQEFMKGKRKDKKTWKVPVICRRRWLALALELGPGPKEYRRHTRPCGDGQKCHYKFIPSKLFFILLPMSTTEKKRKLTEETRQWVEVEPELQRPQLRLLPDKRKRQRLVPFRAVERHRAKLPLLPILNGIGMTWILARLSKFQSKNTKR